MAILIMLIGALITGVFVFMTFRIDYGVKNQVLELVQKLTQAELLKQRSSFVALQQQMRKELENNERTMVTLEQQDKEAIQKINEGALGDQLSKSDIEKSEKELEKKEAQYTYNEWITDGIINTMRKIMNHHYCLFRKRCK